MTTEGKMTVSAEELEMLWVEWKSDKRLHEDLRFGQFVMQRKAPKGFACPKLFFADTGTAVDLLKRLSSGEDVVSFKQISYVEDLEDNLVY